jgi:CheY-like chemotaxis protein
MSRILLADDSPHAQRMGERILREEGFQVVTVTDGETAILRLSDVDPDVVFADVSLPGRSGYDICRDIKSHPRHRHVRVVLTAGMLEHFDEAQAVAVRCDAVLKKPFEASVVLETIKPLAEAAGRERAERGEYPADPEPPVPSNVVPVRVVREPVHTAATLQMVPRSGPAPRTLPHAEPAANVDAERVRAAVTVALDAAMPAMIDEITERVLVALGH